MEREYKFYLPSGCTAEDIVEDHFWDDFAGGPWRRHQHRAVYYSDREGILEKARVVLRLRREDEDYILTVKKDKALEEALSLRHEWNYPLKASAFELPALISALRKEQDPAAAKTADLMALIEEGTLYSEMSTDIIRYEKIIEMPALKAAVSVDSGVLRAGESEEACRELEAEYLSGDPDVLDEIAAKIREHFSLDGNTENKFTRLLRLRRHSAEEGR